MWSEFRTSVQLATHILVLGHALNDEHLVRELASTKARIAVTYLSFERPTADSAEDAEVNEQSIKKLLPGATPIATQFGPDLTIDRSAIEKWRS